MLEMDFGIPKKEHNIATSIYNFILNVKVKMLKSQHGPWLAICVCIITVQCIWFVFNPGLNCQSHGGFQDTDNNVDPALPERTIYVITPTYRRLHQIAELTRFAQTLMLVPDLVWLVVEDEEFETVAVENLLRRTKLKYVHLVAPMPEKYKKEEYRPRGVSNRNKGLEWIRSHATTGVIFFADDDNTYDIRLFEEMRQTEKVSMWPVGLLSAGFATPVVSNGELIGFYEGWVGGRKFPVDMAEFAVSVEFLLQRPNAKMPFTVGFEEDGFLKSLHPLEYEEIELRASNCTEILVWHTQTKAPRHLLPLNLTNFAGTNLVDLYNTQAQIANHG